MECGALLVAFSAGLLAATRKGNTASAGLGRFGGLHLVGEQVLINNSYEALLCKRLS